MVRDELRLESELVGYYATLWPVVERLIESGTSFHACMMRLVLVYRLLGIMRNMQIRI